MDLIEVVRQCPDLTVSIRLGDLIEANQSLVEEALMRLEKSVAESRADIYLSRTKVMEMVANGHNEFQIRSNLRQVVIGAISLNPMISYQLVEGDQKVLVTLRSSSFYIILSPSDGCSPPETFRFAPFLPLRFACGPSL